LSNKNPLNGKICILAKPQLTRYIVWTQRSYLSSLCKLRSYCWFWAQHTFVQSYSL